MLGIILKLVGHISMYSLSHLSLGVTVHQCYCTAIAWVWAASGKLFITIEESLGAEEVVSTAAWGGLGKEGVCFSRTVSYPFTSLQGFFSSWGPEKLMFGRERAGHSPWLLRRGLSPQSTQGVS